MCTQMHYVKWHDHQTLVIIIMKLHKDTEWNNDPGSVIGLYKLWGMLMEAIKSMFWSSIWNWSGWSLWKKKDFLVFCSKCWLFMKHTLIQVLIRTECMRNIFFCCCCLKAEALFFIFKYCMFIYSCKKYSGGAIKIKNTGGVWQLFVL